MNGFGTSFSLTRLFEKGFLYTLTTGSFIVDMISLKYRGVLFIKRYMFFSDEKSNTFLKKLANRIKTVLLFVKALFFSKNLDSIPKERKKYDSPRSVLNVGKNLLREKFRAKTFVGLKNLRRFKLYPLSKNV